VAAVDIVQKGVKHGRVVTQTAELVGGVAEVGLVGGVAEVGLGGGRGGRCAAVISGEKLRQKTLRL